MPSRPLFFYNTLTRKKELFQSIVPGEVSLYTCGPTVYHYAHIGNLRTYLFEDLLSRLLQHAGFHLKHVMNITDVGHLESDADEGLDKMEIATQREAKTPWEIAQFYEEAFFLDLERLHVLKPAVIARATAHIPEIIVFIQTLESKGFTYTVDGNVYFRVDNAPDYAILTGRKIKDLETVSRVDPDPRKENPLDFVLWFSNSKYPHQIMKWDSPWGVGFPGWHIECSTIASKYLGQHIDIHCGGIDHIPVHHTNEIAQSEGCFGHKWVNFWMHGEFLVLAKAKMSKSSGQTITLSTLIDQGFDPLHYRYFCFTAHYRSQLFFSEETLMAARNAYESLKNRIISWTLAPDPLSTSDLDVEKSQDYSTRFWQSIYDDLNTPVAISVMWEMVKDQHVSSHAKLTLMRDFDRVLGFNIDTFSRPKLSLALMEMVEAREQARRDQDWAKADELRQKLLIHGIQIKDLKNGSDWYCRFDQ